MSKKEDVQSEWEPWKTFSPYWKHCPKQRDLDLCPLHPNSYSQPKPSGRQMGSGFKKQSFPNLIP